MKIILDANVLIAAAISGRGAPRELLRCWERGEFELITSPELLLELREVLARPKFHRYISQDDVTDYVMLIHEGASEVHLPEKVERVFTRDPDDDYLIELTVHGRADILVSGDRHLLELGTIDDGAGNMLARILTPREFLDELSK